MKRSYRKLYSGTILRCSYDEPLCGLLALQSGEVIRFDPQAEGYPDLSYRSEAGGRYMVAGGVNRRNQSQQLQSPEGDTSACHYVSPLRGFKD